jgi:hypothetical protein
MALRQMAITPRYVNRQYETLAGERGSTIDVPIPSAIAVQEVSPAATPPSTADVAPTSVSIALDQWWEAPFYLTDKDILTAMNGIIPMQAGEAIKAIANKVDSYILGLYPAFYGYVEETSSGSLVVPFAGGTTTPATSVRKVLNNQLCPLDDRHVIMNPDVEAAALNLRAFQDASWTGDINVIMNGNLNRKLGFQWWMDQNVPYHTAGTLTDGEVNANTAAGLKTVVLKSDTGGTLKIGDIISFAGHSQTYSVQANVTIAGSGTGSVSIEPALQSAVTADMVVTKEPSRYVNQAWHRDAIAFATRPLANVSEGLGSITASAADPISGLTLRLEVTREHKRTRYSYDIMWGAKVVRPQFGCQLASP